MAKKKSGGALAGRVWSRLRLAMLWIRKGGAFKRGTVIDLHFFPRGGGGGLKNLIGRRQPERLYYRERELSFPDTPEFHFKTPSMRFLRIPCITPAVEDLDYLEDYALFRSDKEREVYEADVKEAYDDAASVYEDEEEDEEDEDGGEKRRNEYEMEEEDGIDWKAEEFIRKFYEQMKLQRQISSIQYNEMLERGN